MCWFISFDYVMVYGWVTAGVFVVSDCFELVALISFIWSLRCVYYFVVGLLMVVAC